MPRKTGYRVLIMDDDEEHLQSLFGYLSDAVNSEAYLFGEQIPKIETESDARIVESLIRSCSRIEDFPYDIIIADVFMPLDPDKDHAPDPKGGAVRVYNAIKEMQLHENVFLVIMTNLNSEARPELDKMLADQKNYEIPWAITHYPKPETTPGPSAFERLWKLDDWKYAVGRAVGRCKDKDWKQTFVRATLQEIVGNSSLLTEVKLKAERFARDNERLVVITGETGSGKELIAQALHRNSARSQGGTLDHFKPVNCVNLDGQTTISQLFGHERGAFTGAETAAQGIFEQMQNGTVFLDEFGANLETARMLDERLRILLSKWDFQRMQGTRILHFNGTVIIGGSKIDWLLKTGKMEPDFVSRVGGAPRIDVPPLRERREDVPPLAEFFLQKACALKPKTQMILTDDAKRLLQAYSWEEGNVRQLEFMMNRLSKLLQIKIDVEDLPEKVRTCSAPAPTSADAHPDLTAKAVIDSAPDYRTPQGLARLIREHGNNQTKVAAFLKLTPNRILQLMRKFRSTDSDFAKEFPKQH